MQSHVYAIKNLVCGWHKIGHAKDPVKRSDSLQSGSVDPLRLMRTIPVDNGPAAEAKMHRHFNLKRMVGEWFNITTEEFDAAAATILNPMSPGSLPLDFTESPQPEVVVIPFPAIAFTIIVQADRRAA